MQYIAFDYFVEKKTACGVYIPTTIVSTKSRALLSVNAAIGAYTCITICTASWQNFFFLKIRAISMHTFI